MRILFVTGNAHKLREAKEILKGEVIGKDLDLPEIQSLDPKAIISEKLREARTRVDEDTAIMVEDVSLWVGETGLPGPLIKFFLESVGREGIVLFGKAFGKGCRCGGLTNSAFLIDDTNNRHRYLPLPVL